VPLRVRILGGSGSAETLRDLTAHSLAANVLGLGRGSLTLALDSSRLVF